MIVPCARAQGPEKSLKLCFEPQHSSSWKELETLSSVNVRHFKGLVYPLCLRFSRVSLLWEGLPEGNIQDSEAMDLTPGDPTLTAVDLLMIQQK